MPLPRTTARQAYELRTQGRTWREINVLLGLPEARTTRTREAATAYARSFGHPTPDHLFAPRRRSARVSAPTGLTFGVELECNRLLPHRAYDALLAAGVRVTSRSWGDHHRNPVPAGTWIVTSDATVSGCEVVSPPLDFSDESFAEIRLVTETMRRAGATVGSNCGTHVHLGMQGLTRQQIVSIARTYNDRQDAIDGLVAQSRRGSGGSWNGRIAGRSAGFERVADAFVQGHRTNRYVNVNFNAYDAHGTLEFRQHQGTLSVTKIEHWVRMLFALRAAALAGDTTISTGLGFLGDLAAAGHLPRRTANYLTRRATRFVPAAAHAAGIAR